MSRLTHSPFHKPSPFESPRPPLSPPETNVDPIGPAQMPTPMTAEAELHSDHAYPPLLPPASSPETAGARFRRVSTLTYHNSGLRESRERTVQRSTKSFIIVVPPPGLLQEHGQLGHTLSLGPRHRLSEGILMPLFPTMYGQLTAIAREFNFPSTTGLCLYLHFIDNGITAVPRVSDDAWQFIWTHVFESSSPNPSHKLPISGKIEFDVDLRQARWYTSWIASAHNPHIEPMPVPSTSSPFTYRENRTSEDDPTNNHSVTLQHNILAPTSRHVPKKLSLVDRFDSLSARSGSRPASRTAFLSPPEHGLGVQALPPIFQEEEPKSAKLDLERRVNTWRAGASLTATPLVARGQTESANVPSSIPLDDSRIPAEDELNLDDFAWSASSVGPNDYDLESPLSWDRLPSVHLANRMEGSVCLTPSDCTSFGPSDYTLPSPVSSFNRLPSPDLAHRMYEDSPQTPSTATSWGPSSRSSSSSVSIHHPRSIHLDRRGDHSRPMSPSTAASCGAPPYYAPSPITPCYAWTSDAGRCACDAAVTEHHTKVFAFPYYDPWKCVPWAHAWPYIQREDNTHRRQVWPQRQAQTGDDQNEGILWSHIWPYIQTSDAGERAFDGPESARASRVVAFPYYDPWKAIPWVQMWPYNQRGDHLPWSQVWPYHEAQVTNGEDGRHHAPSSHISPCSTSTLPDAAKDHQCPVSVIPSTSYPYLIIYRAVYPHFDLYPSLPAAENDRTPVDDARFTSCLRLPVSVVKNAGDSSVPAVVRPAAYSASDFYPAHCTRSLDEICPSTTNEARSSVAVKLLVHYPLFNLYPAVYPHIMPYPPTTIKMDSRPTEQTCRYLDFGLDHSITEHSVRKVSRYMSSVYPEFNLYPAMHSTGDANYAADKLNIPPVQLRMIYPTFNLYPVVYPAFNIYPAIEGEVDSGHFRHGTRNAATSKSLSVRLNTSYPIFHLYPAIYPTFTIYPALPDDLRDSCTQNPLGYPHFNLYPALNCSSNGSLEKAPSIGYTDDSIHPCSTPHMDNASLVVTEPSRYPVFNLYPSVYPHFDLYPPPSSKMEDYKRITVKLTSRYPSFDLYPSIYPYFDLWPSISPPEMSPLPKLGRLTHAELHAMVMIEDFESRISIYSPGLVDYPVHKPQHGLHQDVVPAGVVSTPNGTGNGSNFPPDVEPTSFSQSHGESITQRRISESSSRPHPRLVSATARSRHSTSLPSPIRRLPTPPTRGSRLSTAFELMSTLVSDSRPSPKMPSANAFVSTSARRPSLVNNGGMETPHLSPVEEQRTQFGVHPLNRSSVAPVRPETESVQKLDPTFSAPIAESIQRPAQKRDSVTLRRMKAYNNSPDGGVAPMEAFPKSPVPPRPPLPPVPRH